MRRIILLSTVLLATPFGMGSYAADCATTSCQELGYTATSNKGNCLQCPFGNYWFCPESQCDSSYKYTCKLVMANIKAALVQKADIHG